MQNVDEVRKQLKIDVSKTIDAIANWREFDFKLGGVSCHYDYYHGIEVVDTSDLANKEFGKEFWKLLGHIHQFQEQIGTLRLDLLEVNKIIYKYFRMEARTIMALGLVGLDVMSDLENLSPERLQFLDSLYQDGKKATTVSK